jgi:F0F1-type ATP synthase membrane subunit b/b'
VAVAQEARISAEAAREALLERAQAEAAEVATRATHEARAALVAAEARLSGAVERALRQLVG